MKCDTCIHRDVCKIKPPDQLPEAFKKRYEQCKHYKEANGNEAK